MNIFREDILPAMQKISYSIVLIFFTFLLTRATGQIQPVDSLKEKISKTITNDEKLQMIVELSEQAVNADTLLFYVAVAEKIAATSSKKTDKDKAAFCRAGYYVRKNITDSALVITDALLNKYKTNQQEQPFYLRLLFFKAKILDRANQFTLALSQLMQVIQTAETLKDTLILIQAKTGIGWVQMEMEQYKEALEWLYKAKHTSADQRFYKNYGALFSNMANAYNALGMHDSARYYIDVAIKDARINNNFIFLATALSIQAKIFIDNGEAALAEAPLHEVIEIRKKLNDPFYTVYDMSSLARYYASNRQTQKGIELCMQGIALAKQSGLSSQLLMIYHALAENYKVAGKNIEYAKTLEEIILLKDSFNNINSAKLLADMQAGNEAQKNEKKLLEQKLALTQKNYWLYGSALFILMAAVITWLGFVNYRRKEKMKMEIALGEEKQLSAKAVLNAAEQERKRIAADLHDNLGAYAAAIASNVDQIGMNHNQESALKELKINSQSIVSQLNDTIWVLKKDYLSLTAISDRIKTFMQRIGPSYPQVTMAVTEQINNDILLPPAHAFHLYQVTKEAVSNALKHSSAKNIRVYIESEQEWKLTISDDGNGMPPMSTKASRGNGLQNMQNRSKEAGWKISWLSDETDGGTTVMIEPTSN